MKKRRAYFVLILAVLVMAVTAILVINKKVKIAPVLASRYEVAGVDVSRYQGTIDWPVLAKQGLDFAYIKATG